MTKILIEEHTQNIANTLNSKMNELTLNDKNTYALAITFSPNVGGIHTPDSSAPSTPRGTQEAVSIASLDQERKKKRRIEKKGRGD